MIFMRERRVPLSGRVPCGGGNLVPLVKYGRKKEGDRVIVWEHMG